MRIYVLPQQDTFVAFAPEIPGSGLTGHEPRPTRTEALDRCRAFVKNEIAAYLRLGVPLPIAPAEEIIEWTGPWWLIAEWLIPMRPADLRAALARMDDLAGEVERLISGRSPLDLDRHASGEWSAQTTLDHVSHGLMLAPIQLDPLPLDPVEAQSAALRELVTRLRASIGRADAVHHFGTNAEGARIRWTPRKVARSARTLQEAWTRFAADGGAPPRPPFGHDDRLEDDEPLTEADIAPLLEADPALRAATARDQSISRIALWYRYYRSRLTSWPEDALMRWRAMYAAFRDRLASADEAELALVRMSPFGIPATIRGELRLGIGHVIGHLDQIRAVRTATT